MVRICRSCRAIPLIKIALLMQLLHSFDKQRTATGRLKLKARFCQMLGNLSSNMGLTNIICHISYTYLPVYHSLSSVRLTTLYPYSLKPCINAIEKAQMDTNGPWEVQTNGLDSQDTSTLSTCVERCRRAHVNACRHIYSVPRQHKFRGRIHGSF